MKFADLAAKTDDPEQMQAYATLSLAKSSIVVTEELMRIRRHVSDE